MPTNKHDVELVGQKKRQEDAVRFSELPEKAAAQAYLIILNAFCEREKSKQVEKVALEKVALEKVALEKVALEKVALEKFNAWKETLSQSTRAHKISQFEMHLRGMLYEAAHEAETNRGLTKTHVMNLAGVELEWDPLEITLMLKNPSLITAYPDARKIPTTCFFIDKEHKKNNRRSPFVTPLLDQMKALSGGLNLFGVENSTLRSRARLYQKRQKTGWKKHWNNHKKWAKPALGFLALAGLGVLATYGAVVWLPLLGATAAALVTSAAVGVLIGAPAVWAVAFINKKSDPNPADVVKANKPKTSSSYLKALEVEEKREKTEQAHFQNHGTRRCCPHAHTARNVIAHGFKEKIGRAHKQRRHSRSRSVPRVAQT